MQQYSAFAHGEQEKIVNALNCIKCSDLSYEEWINVGMALHDGGSSWEVWDRWSQTDPDRYQPGSCETHWRSFSDGGGVTVATLFFLAKEYGYEPSDSDYMPTHPKAALPAKKKVDYSIGRAFHAEYVRQCQSRIEDPNAVRYIESRGYTLEQAKAFGWGYDPTPKTGWHENGTWVNGGRLIMVDPSCDYMHCDRAISDTVEDHKWVFPYAEARENRPVDKCIGKLRLINRNALKADTIIVVEGMADMYAMFAMGFPNTVAIGGTASGRLTYEVKHKRFNGNAIIMLDHDSDPSKGPKNQRALVDKLRTMDIIADGFEWLPDDLKDPDEMWRAGRGAEFAKRVDTAIGNIRLLREASETIDAVRAYDSTEELKEDDTGLEWFSNDGKFEHWRLGDALINDYHACVIDGFEAIWDGTKYATGTNAQSVGVWESAARQLCRRMTVGNVRNVLGYLRTHAPSFKGDRNLIATADGKVLDVHARGFGDGTHGVYEMTPRYHICNVLAARYDPCAYDDDMDRFLDDLSDYDKSREHDLARINLEEVLAASIYAGPGICQAVFLDGEPGCGKTAFLGVLQRFVGEDNFSTQKLHDIGDRFGLPPLVGKLINTGDDLSHRIVSDSAATRFRSITSKAPQSVEEKGQPIGRGVTIYCHLIFATNGMPRFEVSDEATLERCHKIAFTRRFRRVEGKEVVDIAEVLTNPTTHPHALSFLLNIALMRLPDMLKRGCYTQTLESDETIREMKILSDNVAAFLDEQSLDVTSLNGRSTLDTFNAYVSFCDRSGIRSDERQTKQGFTKAVCNILGMVAKRHRVGGKREYVFASKMSI